MKKIDLKNLFKNKPHFRKGGFHANPNIGWELILGLSLGIIVGFGILGAYLFLETNKEFNAATSSIENEVMDAREKQLEKMLQIFSERANRSKGILASPAAVVDPAR